MGKHQAAKTKAGQRNADRKCGKRWKQNKSPEQRAQERRLKAELKRLRKATV